MHTKTRYNYIDWPKIDQKLTKNSTKKSTERFVSHFCIFPSRYLQILLLWVITFPFHYGITIMADVSLILLFIFLAAGTFLSRSPPGGTNVLNIIFPITIIRNSQFWRKIHRHFSSHWVKCSVFGFGRFFFSEQLTIKVLLLTLGGRALYLSIISFRFFWINLDFRILDFRFFDF